VINAVAIRQVLQTYCGIAAQMRPMLIWPIFSSVARPLLSDGLVVGKHPQKTLVRPLVHGSGLHRQGAAPSHWSLARNFSTRRAERSHGWPMIGNASAFAATEKPDAVIGIASIEDAR
jgi:hypothetical protein